METTSPKGPAYVRPRSGAPGSVADGLGYRENMRVVYVWEAPLRIWKFVTAAAVLVLMVTGYLIGKPLPSVGGEASDYYVMGYVRMIHFIAGQTLAVAFIGRIYWAFVGNRWARELFAPSVFSREFWEGFWWKIRYYLFLTDEKRLYIGHNPLQNLASFVLFVLVMLWMIASGLAMYGEGLGAGSWASTLFGWVIPLVGQSQDVHTFHRLGMWMLLIFTAIHVYFVFRDDIDSRQAVLSSMASGYRHLKD